MHSIDSSSRCYIVTYLRYRATLLHILHFSLCPLQSRVVLVNSRLNGALSFPYRLLPLLETCHCLLEFRCSLNNQYIPLNVAKAHTNRKTILLKHLFHVRGKINLSYKYLKFEVGFKFLRLETHVVVHSHLQSM